MSEDDKIFSDNEKYEFRYSLFVRLVLWLGGLAMVLLSPIEIYRGTLDYKENEHLYAFGVFLLGLVAIHAAWRTLGRIIFTEKGLSHVHLGRTTFISYSAIREIRNRPWLMSLKVIGPEAVIYIEKQIHRYPLAYEILYEKVGSKLVKNRAIRLSVPYVVHTTGKQYIFALSICAVAGAVIGWQFWRNEYNLLVLGLACGFLLFGIYLLYVLYLKIEIDRQGIVIKSLFSRVTIPRNHIESLFLERDYGSEDDPTFNIHIDYLDMPVDDAPDEAEVYTSVISGALIDVSIEALFDLIIREYGFEEDVGKKD